MTQGNVLKIKIGKTVNSRKIFGIFFLKMRPFENKNLPKFENDLKWPTFRAKVKN